MQLQQMFDAYTVPPSSAPEPVPAGKYQVVIESSEPKETKDKTGGMLVLTCKIIAGQYSGKTFNYNLNLFNASMQAVEIAYRQLSAICYVTGKIRIQATEELHNIPFVVDLQINAAGYNDVKRVYDLNGNQPGQTGAQGGNGPVATAPPAAQPTAPPTNAAPPAWLPPGTATAQAPPQPPAAPVWGAPGTPAASAPSAATQPPAWQQSSTPPAAAPPWAR